MGLQFTSCIQRDGGSLFSQTLHKNSKFFVIYSLVNVNNSPKTANLYTFTKETFNGKLHFFATLKNYGPENYTNIKIMKHVKNMSKLKGQIMSVFKLRFVWRGRRLGLKKGGFSGLQYICVRLIPKRKLRN